MKKYKMILVPALCAAAVFLLLRCVLLVKRIAAVAGDKVVHNGDEFLIPTNAVYVLGDNQEDSWYSLIYDPHAKSNSHHTQIPRQ